MFEGKNMCVHMCISWNMMCVDKCMCIYDVCMYVHISNIEHRMAARAEGALLLLSNAQVSWRRDRKGKEIQQREL